MKSEKNKAKKYNKNEKENIKMQNAKKREREKKTSVNKKEVKHLHMYWSAENISKKKKGKWI